MMRSPAGIGIAGDDAIAPIAAPVPGDGDILQGGGRRILAQAGLPR